jgi:TPR repeat protein
MYENGKGVKKNNVEALILYQLAAANGEYEGKIMFNK